MSVLESDPVAPAEARSSRGVRLGFLTVTAIFGSGNQSAEAAPGIEVVKSGALQSSRRVHDHHRIEDVASFQQKCCATLRLGSDWCRMRRLDASVGGLTCFFLILGTFLLSTCRDGQEELPTATLNLLF